jgi:hypothetical protein
LHASGDDDLAAFAIGRAGRILGTQELMCTLMTWRVIIGRNRRSLMRKIPRGIFDSASIFIINVPARIYNWSLPLAALFSIGRPINNGGWSRDGTANK